MQVNTVRVQDFVPYLAAQVDDETMKLLKDRREIDFVIRGDSIFTRSVKKKLDKLGIKYFDTGSSILYGGRSPFIIDLETEKGYLNYNISGENDIDCCVKTTNPSDWSCVSEACYRIITNMSDYKNAHVGIVGRGHAVLGLAKHLLDANYTVTQCHSKTKDLNKALETCDIIVYAAPEWHPIEMKNRIVLDVSYTIPKELGNPFLINNIGTLNTSIVVNRAAARYLALKSYPIAGNESNTRPLFDGLFAVPC